MAAEYVLVVDDNEQNCLVAEANLVAAGYAVGVAHSGTEAVRLFKERTPDLVLLDIMMPEMDGFETCRQIRSLPPGVDVPVVFLTSLRDLESHQKALDAGGDDVLAKPFNRSELLLRVRSMMWMRRLRTELRSGYTLISSQRDALIRAQRQKEELTNLIVHDLKNPIHIVSGCIQRLAKQKSLEEEKSVELVRRIANSAKMMEQMVLNMLDISRSEDGAFAPKMAKFDMAALVAQVGSEMEAYACERKVKITVSCDVKDKELEGDPDLLRRMLENLIDNAVRYAPVGGDVQMHAATTEDGQFEVRVKDQGRGIPPELREKIFEKYFQLDDETVIHNQGLGLTFCRLAAQAHGGRIWVEENKPKGAVFCVKLPATQKKQTLPVSSALPSSGQIV